MRGVPGFQAEASLDHAWGRYRATAAFVAPRAAGGVSMRVSPMASIPGLGLRIDLFPPIRCCRFVPMWGRFFCVERRVSPLEQCSCTQDFFGFPIILCSPPEFVLTLNLTSPEEM
jgi:hypothetical protein